MTRADRPRQQREEEVVSTQKEKTTNAQQRRQQRESAADGRETAVEITQRNYRPYDDDDDDDELFSFIFHRKKNGREVEEVRQEYVNMRGRRPPPGKVAGMRL